MSRYRRGDKVQLVRWHPYGGHIGTFLAGPMTMTLAGEHGQWVAVALDDVPAPTPVGGVPQSLVVHALLMEIRRVPTPGIAALTAALELALGGDEDSDA